MVNPPMSRQSPELHHIRFYCGVAETSWNGAPVGCGKYACVSPVKRNNKKNKSVRNSVAVPSDTLVLQDSGAFSDALNQRISFKEASDRQDDHRDSAGYNVQYKASYDVLIDEMWSSDGQRTKRRWDEDSAWSAVDETVGAARWMVENYDLPAVLSAQGVTPYQYMKCAEQVAPLLRPFDMFGMGGWCINGLMPKVMWRPFVETIVELVPYLASQEVSRVHIWGCNAAEFLAPLLYLCDRHDIQLSTDSVHPSTYPTRGQWGYGGWVNKEYERVDGKLRGLHRRIHVCCNRAFLKSGVRQTIHYRYPSATRSRRGQVAMF